MKIIGLEKEKKALKTAIDAKLPSLLIGPTGCGKTSLIHALAKESGKELVSIPLHGQIGREELLGKWLIKDGATYWQDGILTDAIKQDKWVLFDEINAALPEVLFILHSLLDHQKKISLPEKDNEVLEAKEGFRFFATMNPSEDYVGTKSMNMAFISRFGVVLHFDYLSYKQEAQAIGSNLDEDGVKISEDDCLKIALIGAAIRGLYRDGEIYYPCSTRDLLHAAALLASGTDFMDAINLAIVNKMSDDEKILISKKTEIVVQKLACEKELGNLLEMLANADSLRAEHKKFKDAVKKFKALKQGNEKALNEIEI